MATQAEAGSTRWLRRGMVLVAVAIALAGAAGVVAAAIFVSSLRSSGLDVRNDTDTHVVVSVGTNVIVDLAPRTSATVKRRGDSGVLRIERGSNYKECDWGTVRDQQPLLIDADGIHCHDTRADAPPYPTPVPP